MLDGYLDGYQRGILELYRQNPHLHYPKGEDGKPLCRWCWGKVEAPKRTFCSKECVEGYRLRTDWTYCKKFVAMRDRYICQICKVDCRALKKCLSRMPPSLMLKEGKRLGISQHRLCGKVLYDIDHIVPVVEGGGMTGPEGLRLLCIPCHKTVTKALRQRMKK